MFSFLQDEGEAALESALGNIFIFDDEYDDCDKETLTFNGVDYEIPYPYDDNIQEQEDKSNATYKFIDYDLSEIKNFRDWLRERYISFTDETVIDSVLSQNEDFEKFTYKSNEYIINSPMTVNAILDDELNIEEFDYASVINSFDTNWGNSNWDFR